MKTKTLIILFALVMALSVSAGVFAESAWDETWDEETVLTVFNDLDIIFPDLFADIDSDFLWTESEEEIPTIPNFTSKAISLEDTADYEAKAPAEANATLSGSFDPCGDGLIKLDVTLKKVDKDTYTGTNPYGDDNATYIRTIDVEYPTGTPVEIAKCVSGDRKDCAKVEFNKKGEGKLTIYVYAPGVPENGENAQVTIEASNYFSALFAVASGPVTTPSTKANPTDKNYCQASLKEYDVKAQAEGPSVRAKYDYQTGEARFQATIANMNGTEKINFVIPGEIGIDGKHYKEYTCKYTLYNNANGAPRTDYCEYGKGIALASNALIRFDITLDHIASQTLVNKGGKDKDIDFYFRVGGMKNLITGAFNPVEYPCPVVKRIAVMDPLKPFMTFYDLLDDDPIKPSGAYGVYDGGLWGLYQKCGKYAYMAVRLMNDGVKNELVNIDNVAVAVNGGTPMSWNWVLTTVEPEKGKVELEPGKDVILIGRAKVTDYGYQMNSDQAITGAVNFLDYGFYIQGKVYSDHNNTNCTVAP